METRELKENEIEKALDLIFDVFMKFEAPIYEKKGVETFKNYISNPQLMNKLKFYGTFLDKKIIGASATRNRGNHIVFFFVDEKFHKRGFGRSLFNLMLENRTENLITVNSSPYAFEIYKHFGFSSEKGIQESDGIKYYPMVLKLGKTQ